MAWLEKYLEICGKSFYELPQDIVEGVRRRLARELIVSLPMFFRFRYNRETQFRSVACCNDNLLII